MRPVLNLFFLFGSSVGFYANPMMRRVAVSSFAGSTIVRAASATALPSQRQAKFTTSMNSVDFVEKEIDSNNVVVFSKSYCPFCTRTKNLFAGLGVDATVYELDQMDDGEAIQAILGAKTGQATVPNVFVKGTHVGGNDAVQAANSSGALKTLLDG
ncbi:unnamed protein product [Ectocarpus sp. 6 AP-2014]